MLIDLQFHSTYSDGYLTPTQLVNFLHKKGVKVASLTDHNTVGGLEEFSQACKKKNIKAISGLELYVMHKGKRMNIILYNFDDANVRLHEILRQTQISRRRNTRKILQKLVNRGFKIQINKVLDKHTRYIPINHIVDDLLAEPKNLEKIKRELDTETPLENKVISEYFKNKNIGVLYESYININRILELKKEIGGQIVINHPAKNGYINKEAWVELKDKGLDGIEKMSPHHSLGAIMYIQTLTRELDLIETGGSDFHRFEGFKYPVQSSFDYFKIDSDYLRGIKKII